MGATPTWVGWLNCVTPTGDPKQSQLGDVTAYLKQSLLDILRLPGGLCTRLQPEMASRVLEGIQDPGVTVLSFFSALGCGPGVGWMSFMQLLF